jgi:hypothetical protein
MNLATIRFCELRQICNWGEVASLHFKQAARLPIIRDFGEGSEGREALRTAGQEAGATVLVRL